MEKAREAIKRYNLIKKGDRIVIGVSGGPDSVALLYVLNGLKKEFNLTLHIAHLDHMLRRESRRDAEFVEALANKLRLPITTARINVKGLAKKGSIEEIARNARLGFLFKVASQIKAKKIALGHNLDDRAETVLMRILRGAGLYGLSGILPKRELSGFTVIRPLIEVRRSEIEAYLRRRKIKPRLDTSNLEDTYFRNKIRNRLLPLLEREYSINIKELLCNIAETAGYDYDYLIRVAGKAASRYKNKIELAWLLKQHPAIQRLVLRSAMQGVKGNLRRINLQHIRELEDLICNRPVNSVVDLPGEIFARKNKKTLSFYKKTQ